jgi:DNA ligase-1
LYKNGKELLSVPLKERRKILEQTLKAKENKHLMLSPQIVTREAGEIRRYHDEQLRHGLEGAVVKKWDSIYEPGRKGFHWVKFKEEEGKTGKLTDTIDAVVMGYYRGEGKRAGFGIGAFLVGVAKGDGFVTVTKIGTGVSDELWKELRRRLNDIKISAQPKQYKDVAKMLIPDVWVAPKIVVELAGDDLTRSPSHGAGYAVRFPRLVKIRDDKSPRQATTDREIEAMYRNQGK